MVYTCQRCKKEFTVNIMVPDNIWNLIKPLGTKKGEGVLCSNCIVTHLEVLSKEINFHLIRAQNGFGDPLSCDKNHKKVYFECGSCPVCNLIDENKELRDMYMQEYSKVERWGK